MNEKKITKLTVGDLTVLSNAYKNSQMFRDMETDKLIMFWLSFRNIDYSIKSEFELKTEDLKNENYNIIRR